MQRTLGEMTAASCPGRWKLTAIMAIAALLFTFGAGVAMAGGTPSVDPNLATQLRSDPTTGYLIFFEEKADLSRAFQIKDRDERATFVYNALVTVADRTQRAVKLALNANHAVYKAFWIDNVIVVERSNAATFNALLSFGEIAELRARPKVILHEPVSAAAAAEGINAAETNLSRIRATDVWAMGFHGTGIVVGNIDTGVRYTHTALTRQYRGNLGGGTFSHDYNWFDPYSGTPAPVTTHDHGSHTMGIMLGEDAAKTNQVGMAPDAKWMACLGFNPSATDAGLLGCAQFMAAPTKTDGTVPDPAKHPDVINNSWGDCQTSYDNWYAGVITSWHAMGIYPVFSTGNASNCGYSEPPGCSTVGNPGRYGNVSGIGASTKASGAYATFSNWGPTDDPDTVNPTPGFATLKPQVIAPGDDIRSCYATSDTSYGNMGGTSMAAPHVAGLVALIWEAAPCLKGNYAQTESIIEQTAIAKAYASSCGGEGPGNVPNFATGWGEIDALAAVQLAVTMCGPTGTLTGSVTTEGGTPLEGASVTAEEQTSHETKTATTNAAGVYNMTYLPVGTYDVTASRFGFAPVTITGIVVGDGDTITQDFALTAVGSFVVDGFVTSADHQWPLWAKVEVKQGATVVATLYTSPWNGYYEIEMPNGLTYDFTVHSMYVGYVDEVRPVTLSSADQTQNFTLLAASGNPAYACVLEGGINESFDGAFPPAGWTVKNNGSGANNVWKRNDVWGRANMTGGALFAAAADSDKAGSGSGPFNTELWSPPIKMPATPRNLAFKSAYTSYSGETGTLDVSTNGGTTWTNLLTITATSVAEQVINLTAYANQTIVLRWTFVSPSYAYWWQIDDVRTQTIPPPPPPPVSQWTQNFDGVTAPALPSGWAMVRTGGTATATAWVTNTGTVHPTGGGTHSGTNLAYFNAYTVSSGNAARLYKTTGENLSSGTGYVRLWMYHDTGYTNADAVQVQYSTDGGTTWNNTGSPIARYSGAVGWAQHDVMMLGVSGASVLIGLNATSAYGNDIHIDDVEFLVGAAATPPVADNPVLTCSAVAGSMVAGFVTDENSTNGIIDAKVERDLGGQAMTIDATGNLPAGFYYMFSPKPVVTAPDGPSTRTFTASKTGYGSVSHQVLLVPDTINRLDFSLPSGWLEVTPTLLQSWVYPTETEDFTLSLINHGGLPVNYKLLTMPVTPTWPHSAKVTVPNGNQRPASIRRAKHAPDHLTIAPHVERYLASVGAVAVDIYPGATLVSWADLASPGTWTSGAAATGNYWAGDFLNGDFSKLYVIDAYEDTGGTGTDELRTLDTTTGAVTVIGTATPAAGESWSGLSGAPSGVLYGAATTCGASTLYTINPATGAVHAIGPITNGACIIDIAVNSAGEMYGIDLIADTLVKIDPATGAGTVVGSLGADANYAQGMDFDDVTGVLYWAAYTAQGELRIIDTTTGSSSLVGAFPGGDEVDSLAIKSFAGAGGLPWLELTPTEGVVPPYLQEDANAHFIADGATNFGLHRATIKVTHDTAYVVPDVNACMTKGFLDVPKGNWKDTHIHALAGTRIAGSYDEWGYFRPEFEMTRGALARWLLRAKYGPDYSPSACTGLFTDVLCETTPNADYIEDLYREGITTGCATTPSLRYCPDVPVTRAQMAILLLRTKLGSGFTPEPCTGVFVDLPCPSHRFANWVEAFYKRGFTDGCNQSPKMYCPDAYTTRAQMAKLTNATFSIPTTCVIP